MRRESIAPADRIGLSRELAASLIGVSPGTFDGLVARGEMPRPKGIGARRVWARAEIEAAFDRLSHLGPGTFASPPSKPQTSDPRPPWERRAS